MTFKQVVVSSSLIQGTDLNFFPPFNILSRGIFSVADLGGLRQNPP